MKVKIFNFSALSTLEDSINKWLENNSDKIVIDHILQSVDDSFTTISIFYTKLITDFTK